MNKPSKGNLRLKAIIYLVVGTLIITWFFLFMYFAKTEWRDAPVFSEAINVQTQLTNNSSVRTTTFTVYKKIDYFVLFYFAELRHQDWDDPIIGSINRLFIFTDRTKNIGIPGFNNFYYNDCPAFYLQTNFESVAEEETKVTLVQTVGPCGKPQNG